MGIGYWIGHWGDGKLGTKYLALIGLFVGIYAGFRNLMKAAAFMQKEADREAEADLRQGPSILEKHALDQAEKTPRPEAPDSTDVGHGVGTAGSTGPSARRRTSAWPAADVRKADRADSDVEPTASHDATRQASHSPTEDSGASGVSGPSPRKNSPIVVNARGSKNGDAPN